MVQIHVSRGQKRDYLLIYSDAKLPLLPFASQPALKLWAYSVELQMLTFPKKQ